MSVRRRSVLARAAGSAAIALSLAATATACGGGGERQQADPAPTTASTASTTASSAATTASPVSSAPASSSTPLSTIPASSTAVPATPPGTTPPSSTTPASSTPTAPTTAAEPETTTTGAAPVAPVAPVLPTVAPTVRDGTGGFRLVVRGIDADLRRRIEPTSWRPGCPVELDELRYLELGYWGFDGVAHTGELIVHRDVVADIESVFQALWLARFPIRSMRLIDDFGGDDFSSIEADNTSAFNCRFVEGTTRWSNHATGRAIDINPIENPYVSGGSTSHPASVPYLDRAPAPGVIVDGGPVTAAFDAVGWDWGGRWSEPLDYQHFSATGG